MLARLIWFPLASKMPLWMGAGFAKYSNFLTNYPNGIQRAFRNRIEQAASRHSANAHFYRNAYAGNLGEGQDLRFLHDLASRPDLQQRMRDGRIRFDIFGSGAQVKALKALTAEGDTETPPGPLAHLVCYCGLLPRDEVETIYAHADCLMLQLGLYSSLSMVIPTKIFEYAATPYPICSELRDSRVLSLVRSAARLDLINAMPRVFSPLSSAHVWPR